MARPSTAGQRQDAELAALAEAGALDAGGLDPALLSGSRDVAGSPSTQ